MSSISNDSLFWTVNHTSIFRDSELNVCKKIWFFGEISYRLPNGLSGASAYWILNLADNVTMN